MPQLRALARRVRQRFGTEPEGHVLGGSLAALVPSPLRTAVVVADDVWAGVVDETCGAVEAERVIVVAPYPQRTWEDAPHVEHRHASDLVETNWVMRFRSDIDLVVDVGARTGDEYDAWWHRLFLHLQPGGLYLIDRRQACDEALPPRLTAYAETIDVPPEVLIEKQVGDRPRRRAIASVDVADDAITMGMQGRFVLKTKDTHANRVLPEREPELGLEVLTTLPAGDVPRRARVHSHTPSVEIPWIDGDLTHPELHLRHYTGRIAMCPNALLLTGRSALPDSFRHHLAYSPTNPRLIDASGDFARTRPRDVPERELSGSYYHLDSENPGHFGHLLTEVVGRLWGWHEAKARIPDLKAIFRVRGEDAPPPTLELRVLTAFGIAPEDITWVHEPVWLESVVGATPMWHNQDPHYVHPELLGVWDTLRASLLAEGSAPDEGFERSGGERIFVSRRDVTGNRSCRNTRDVEAFFAERGFDVVYPEDHDLAAQAAIFARAEVVAGFGGSAMFNVMHSRDHRTVILLNHEAYTARNERLLLTLLGGDVHYFWSTPDVPHPADGWSEDAYYSPWAFDFERNTGPLDEVIRGL